jgi:hypothetical protein
MSVFEATVKLNQIDQKQQGIRYTPETQYVCERSEAKWPLRRADAVQRQKTPAHSVETEPRKWNCARNVTSLRRRSKKVENHKQ